MNLRIFNYDLAENIIWDKKAINTLVESGLIKRRIHSFKKIKYSNFEEFIKKVMKILKDNKIRNVRIFKPSDLPTSSKEIDAEGAVRWIRKQYKKFKEFEAPPEDFLTIDEKDKILIIIANEGHDLEIFSLE